MAVGSMYAPDRGDFNLAEHWNGAAWSLEKTALIRTTQTLTGVSCVSDTMCIAVGDGSRYCAYRWEGVRWSGQLSCGLDFLEAVSCISDSACVAVGSSSVYEETQQEHDYTLLGLWNGRQWSLHRRSGPGEGATLDAVSCTSSTACTGVGNGRLIERWNGSDWKIQNAPNVRGILYGVSCPSIATCIAVGSTGAGVYGQILIERWNGQGWSIEPARSPRPSKSVYLSAVSCTSTTTCVAVGLVEDRTFSPSPLVASTTGPAYGLG
jgi:hypothetical protein